MIAKYRVHEVARDLGVPSKEILDLLAKDFDGERKSMTALNEQELSLVLDHYTNQNQVESFDAYFADGERRRKEKAADRWEQDILNQKTEPAQSSHYSAAETGGQEDRHPLQEEIDRNLKQDSKALAGREVSISRM